MSQLPLADKKPANFMVSVLTGPYVLLILAALFWGGNIVAGRLAVGHVDPFTLIIGRWGGAILLITPFAWRHVQKDWAKIKPALVPLIMFGAIGFATFNVLMYNAALSTTGVNAAIEQASIPVFVFIGNLVFFAVRPKRLQVVGLGLTIVGVIWVATHGDPFKILSLSLNIGDGMVLIACVIYAFYSLLLRLKPDIHWLSFIFVTGASALVTSIIYQTLLAGGVSTLVEAVPNITTQGWLCILYVMAFPSILSQLFYVRGVEIIGPNRASIFINLLPVFGTILSIMFLGETFEAFHAIASILVVLGIILAEYAVRKTGTQTSSRQI